MDATAYFTMDYNAHGFNIIFKRTSYMDALNVLIYYVFLFLTNYLEQFWTADLCITDAHSLFLSYIS